MAPMVMPHGSGPGTRSSDSGFRWGIIGPGNIAGQFASALTVVQDARLHAVVGRNRRKAEKFAREYGAAVYHDNHLAMLDDPDVDAIYIATPHRYHHDLARDCLSAGKPVLCEKPLTVNARETRALIELSKSQGVFLMEGLWTRFLPIYEQVNLWLLAGKIGKVKSITSSFGFEVPRKPRDRMFNHDLAGGSLLDMGVYNLAMSQWVFGAQPVSHAVSGYLGATGVDEHGETTLTYSDGRHSKFCNSLVEQLDNDFTIFGSNGHIRVHSMFWNATRATLVYGDKISGRRRSESAIKAFRATGLEYEIESAVRCIRKGLIECPVMSHDNTLSTMQLMDALRDDMGLRYAFEETG